jgi:hypothetical protein
MPADRSIMSNLAIHLVFSLPRPSCDSCRHTPISMCVIVRPPDCDIAGKLNHFDREQHDDDHFQHVPLAIPAIIGDPVDRTFIEIFASLQPIVHGVESIRDCRPT